MIQENYTHIVAGEVELTLPPTWFSYSWQADPIPDRIWCWDTHQAVRLQKMLTQRHPELLERVITRFPIEHFREPLAGNVINKEYARSLSTERLAVPLIGVMLPLPILSEGERVGVIIDGCHRLWRRADLGMEFVDVMHMPDEIEEIIRFTPAMVDAVIKLGLV